jgi:leucyl aminopeptidase
MPLSVEVSIASVAPKGAAIGIGVPTSKNGLDLPASVTASAATLAARGFEGKLGQIAVIPGKSSTQILVGLGASSSLSSESFRGIGAALARASFGETALATAVIDQAPTKLDRAAVAAAFTEGVLLASYQFNAYKTKPAPRALANVIITGRGGRIASNGVARGSLIAEAVAVNRDLVNEPPRSLTPKILAERAVEIAAAGDIECTVWDEHDLERERCGGMLGVSIGSDEPPRLIKFVYTPKGVRPGRSKIPTITLVGKGITFDSGGLSLKPSDGMITMKCDMSGAGLVVGIMSVVSRLAPTCRVIGYCCSSENMPGPLATKLGDILTARNGKTVEIHNTDAEGRLVLMDGLSLAAEEKPDAIIDIATLTGAAIVALGLDTTAVMCNNADLRDQIVSASRRTSEDVWELPLPAKYRKHLDSMIADMKNIGNGGQAGSSVAGLFLQEFVDGRPWAHLDIAGPAFGSADEGITTRGGSGVMVRTLIDVIANFTPPK